MVIWTNDDSRWIIFLWSIINLIEMLVASSTLYFSYVFLEKRDVPLKYKIIIGALLTVFIVLIPTQLNLPGFDLLICEAEQGPLIYYFYFLETLFFLWTTFYLIKKIMLSAREKREMTTYFSIGAICFLASFSGTNVVASITGKWEITHYGLFGMPIFMAFLVYLIVKYKAFNINVAIGRLVVYGLYFATALLVGLLIAFSNNRLTQLPFIVIAPFIAVASVAICQLMGYYHKIAHYFYPTFRNTEITIAQLEEKLTEVLETSTMASLLATTLKQAFNLQELAVLVKDLDGPLLIKNNTGFSQPTLNSFIKAIEPSLFPALQKIKKPFGVEEIAILINKAKNSQTADLQQLQQLLQTNQIKVVMPLWFRERLVGLVVLGEKANQDPFTVEDFQLLTALSYQTSIALHNANLYSEIKKRKEELERFYRLTVGREMKMIGLAKKNLELEEKLRGDKQGNEQEKVN